MTKHEKETYTMAAFKKAIGAISQKCPVYIYRILMIQLPVVGKHSKCLMMLLVEQGTSEHKVLSCRDAFEGDAMIIQNESCWLIKACKTYSLTSIVSSILHPASLPFR
ncbi:MAG: hypothetical protein MAG551_00506 [Candidatus Scalindua arabica]|uniref:Uncharacterized protein n=1 Tax=Candidatus Scalindua arabica TaxID=1127984 RepID=A0A942A406_9BACT|nr:hypothetical protein [Candidatus Scalindua arabica]